MNIEKLKSAAEFMKKNFPEARPKCAVILGSGWDEAASAFTEYKSVNYSDIPGMGGTRVAGHAGQLVWCGHGATELLVFKGRRHWYEGFGWEPVVIPVFIARALNADIFFITNAAGGINPDLSPGSLMVIDDHINAMGSNPLMGPYDPLLGARFPDQSRVYDPELRTVIFKAAAKNGQKLHHGVYLAVSGPAYETPAEIEMFKTMGADVVGMSTVPEAMAANAVGLRVLGLTCVANPAAGILKTTQNHEEVQAAVAEAMREIKTLLVGFFKEAVRNEKNSW